MVFGPSAAHPPAQTQDLYDNIGGHTEQQAVEAGLAPWPAFGRMQEGRQGQMPSYAEAEGKDDPFADQAVSG